MTESEMIELIGMLLIETKCEHDENFYKYLEKYSNREKFNTRYMILLDKFLNKYYVIDNTEKSE